MADSFNHIFLTIYLIIKSNQDLNAYYLFDIVYRYNTSLISSGDALKEVVSVNIISRSGVQVRSPLTVLNANLRIFAIDSVNEIDVTTLPVETITLQSKLE